MRNGVHRDIPQPIYVSCNHCLSLQSDHPVYGEFPREELQRDLEFLVVDKTERAADLEGGISVVECRVWWEQRRHSVVKEAVCVVVQKGAIEKLGRV